MIEGHDILDKELVAELGGLADGQLLPSLTAIFAKEMPERLDELDAAVARSDLAAVARIAHLMKGSAGQMGACALAEHCRVVETAARSGDAPTVTAHLDGLREHYRRADLALAAYVEAMPRPPA